MIRLGDVNFALGADTRNLRSSQQTLQNFGRTVESVQQQVAASSTKIAADFRKQEKAAVDALDKTLRLSQQMRKTEGGAVFADRAAAAFRQLNQTLSRGQLDTLQYQRAMERFKASLSNTTREFKQFNDKMNVASTSRFTQGLKSLQSGFIGIQGPLGGISTRISAFSSLMNSGVGAVGAFAAGVVVAGFGIYKFGQQMLQAGVATQKFIQMFQAVTGNVAESEASLRKVIQIARLTGQTVDSLAPSFARFSIAAKGTGLSGREVTREFTVLAQAAGKLQLPAEQSEGIFRALEQMLSKGKVTAEELRQQLGDRLPGAFQIAARAMNTTTQGLDKMMKAGELITEDFLPKFINELQRTLNIDPSKPIKNYTASLNNLTTAWYQYTAELDRTYNVTSKVGKAIDMVTGYVDKLRLQMENSKTATVSFGDYWKALTDKMGEKFATEVDLMKYAWAKMTQEYEQGGIKMTVTNKWAWAKIKEDAFYGIDAVLDYIQNLAQAVPVAFEGIGQSIADALSIGYNSAIEKTKELFNTLNDMLRDHSPMPMTQGPLGANYQLGGYDQDAAWKAAEKRAEERQARLQRIMSQKHGTLGFIVGEVGDVEERARAHMYSRVPNGGYSRRRTTGRGLYHQDEETTKTKTAVELTDKQVKALNRKAEAMAKINDEIERQKEEVDLLGGGTQKALDSLTDKFKREKEVEKYGRALRKAGVDTDFIRQKTEELNSLLEKKDVLLKYREGLVTFRDSLANAFDTVGNSIVDGLFEGENALKSFLNVAKEVAKDIIKTYMQLAILNPIKNALLGTNEPTLQGGLLGNIARAFAGADTSMTAPAASNADSWAGLRGANDNVMPDIGRGIRGSRIGNIFKSAGVTKTGIPLSEVGIQGFTARVNAKYAERFQGLFDDLDKAGYKFKSLGEGGYSYRKVAGSNNLSNHAYGNAVDINPRDNPWSHNKRMDFDKYGIDPNELARKNGLEWGGNWRKPDTMHFQVPKNAEKLSEAFIKATKPVEDMGIKAALTRDSIDIAGKGLEGFGGGLGKLGQSLANVDLSGAGSGGGGGLFGFLGNIFRSLFGGGIGGGTGTGGGGGLGGGMSVSSALGVSDGGLSDLSSIAASATPSSSTSAPIGGGGGNVIVQVYAPEGHTATTKQSTNGSGDNVISVLVQKVKAEIAGDIAKGGTEMNSVIEGRYALKSSAGIK